MTRKIALLVPFLIAVPGSPASAGASSAYADDDIWLLEDCTQDSLENARTNQATVCENPDTGSFGSVTPVETFQDQHGQYCREYEQTIVIEGREHRAYGTACREPDGSWQIVRSRGQTSPPPPPARTLITRERVVYQPVYQPLAPYPAVVPFALILAFGDDHGHGYAVRTWRPPRPARAYRPRPAPFPRWR